MLEIECNLKEINESTVTEQFKLDLQSRVNEAIKIFLANRNNIVNKAIENRNVDDE